MFDAEPAVPQLAATYEQLSGVLPVNAAEQRHIGLPTPPYVAICYCVTNRRHSPTSMII